MMYFNKVLILLSLTLTSCETSADKKDLLDNKWIFSGSATMENGEAQFIWDNADSEVFYLDGVSSWDTIYLNKKITVEGILIQFVDGKSVIKDWKIIGVKNE